MKLIDKDRVVAEIEERLHKYEQEYAELARYEIWGTAREIRPKIEELKNLLSFVSTIETKEVDEEPVIDDLERAALLHYPKMSRISEPHGFIPADNKSHYLGDANEDNRKAFIVGAQWQKQQNAPEVKEINLEEELERLDRILFDLDGVAIKGATCYLTVEDVKYIAKQFFELGLRTKEE